MNKKYDVIWSNIAEIDLKNIVEYIADDSPPNAVKIFKRIIKQIRIIYQKANMIHGDLGEFNIVLSEEGKILIIDWLQWVPSNHPNASTLLERDILNISTFFEKKFNIESNVEEIIESFYK